MAHNQVLNFLMTQAVTSSNEALRKRVEAVLDMALVTISSLASSFKSVASTITSAEENPAKEKDVDAHLGVGKGIHKEVSMEV